MLRRVAADLAGAAVCLAFLGLFDVVFDQIRDIAVIGLLLEHKIVVGVHGWCLIGSLSSNLGHGFFGIDRYLGLGMPLRLTAPSGFAGRCACTQGDHGCCYGRIHRPTGRAQDAFAREIVKAGLALQAHALGTARCLGNLDGRGDDNLVMLKPMRQWRRQEAPTAHAKSPSTKG